MSYWDKRQRQLNRALEKDEAALQKRLEAFYKSEEEKLNRQIASYYANYGMDNIIEYRNLLQRLPESDYLLLMRDMDNFALKYPEYEHLLPVRESIYKLNRLEGLQVSVQVQQLEIGAKEQREVAKHLNELASRSYKAVIDTTGPVAGEWSEMVKSVVGTNWTGKGNFSESIWKNREKLTQMLNNEIASGFVRGDNYASLVSQVRHGFRVGADEAHRMIYTEGTFVMNESRAKAVEGTFEYYSIITAGDARVCSQCRDAQNSTQAKPVKFADRIAGVNFPPFHPWCRCTEQIVVPDQQKWIDEYVTQHGGDPDFTEDQRRKAEEILAKFDTKDKMVANSFNLDIMKSGATSGALTDKNDPFYLKRERHAQAYYESVRNSKKTPVVKIISRNTGMPEISISKVYDHVFINEYNLYGGKKRFDPDYDMAESFRRLREGKEIQVHDLIMLKHERLEYGLMNKLGLPYEQAHALAQRKYNYKKALDAFKDNRGL